MFWPKHLHGPSELAITITIEMERACFPLLIGKNGSRRAALKSHISVSWNAYISNLALYRNAHSGAPDIEFSFRMSMELRDSYR